MAVTFDGTKVSGIHGAQEQENAVVGWEHFTTGVGGDVSIRLNHAQGVRSLDHNTQSMEEPLRVGRFIGVWTKKPTFLSPLVAKYWDYFFQDKIKEVSGLQNNSVSVMERKSGPVGRSDKFLGNFTQNNGTFTIKVPEVKGSPVRKIIKYYLNGVADPITGTAHMHGNSNLRFSKVNYGGDFLFVLLGETMRPDDIHYACMWFNAFPTEEQLAHLNSGTLGESGDAGLEFELEFHGDFAEGDEINKLAQIMTEAVGLYKDTKEDVILPKYIYDQYFGSDNASALAAKFGADFTSRVARAAEAGSAAAEQVQTERKTIIGDTSLDLTPTTPNQAGGSINSVQ